jgi:hypothetical protein
MIWLTWRQQRLEALIGGAIMALLALFLLVTGLDMASAYQHLGVAACLTSQAATCADVLEAFRNQFSTVSSLAPWFSMLPLVFGVLLAAPFVLELEQGTYRLAWTQSITRTRWVTFKLSLLVAAALLVALVLTALVTWWQTPFVQLDGAFQPRAFDVEGTVPLAYSVFAMALGLGIGTLLRRTVPAVAISLTGFLVLRLGLEGWVRPSYLAPVVTAVTMGGLQRSDWVLNSGFRDHLGHPVNPIDVLRLCGVAHGANVARLSESCLQQHGIANVVTYQPGTRFWLFQGIETAIFLGLAVGLLALTVWWVRERIA